MNNIKIDSEVIQVSIYCDVIMAMLKKKKKLSVNKTITYAYLLKKNNYMEKEVFRGNSTKGLVLKSLSLLNGLKDDYIDNIACIIKAVDILKHAELLSLEGEILVLENKDYHESYSESLFFQKAIEESDNFTDRQFLKEVLNNV